MYLHNNFPASNPPSAATTCKRWIVPELKCRPLQLSTQSLSHHQSSSHKMSYDQVSFRVAAAVVVVVVGQTSSARLSRSSKGCCCCCCSVGGQKSSLRKSLRRQNRGRRQTWRKRKNRQLILPFKKQFSSL